MKHWKAVAAALFVTALAACAKPSNTPSPTPPGDSPEPVGIPLASKPAPAPLPANSGEAPMPAKPAANADKVVHTDAAWRKILTPEQYRVMREKGTERPFTGKYTDTETSGVYRCAACGEPLFLSDDKFHSGCGWPAFSKPIDATKVVETKDESYGMVRTEITCAKCGAHQGHVFDDGPGPTHLRYCINSVSIDLAPKTDADKPPAK